jgi:hypothetical protein
MKRPAGRTLALVLAALLVLAASSANPDWKKFDSLHEAATYAALRLEECSHVYECSGVIAQDPADGKYVPGPVRTDYNSSAVQVNRVVPYGWRLVADIHTHPCVPGFHTGIFSDSDLIDSLTSRTISYMVDLCTGDVHEFIPGKSPVDDVKVQEDFYLTAGKIIGHVPAFPDDPKAKEGF